MKTPVAIGLTIVSVVAVSASGLAVGQFLSGGSSAGPESALPDNTVAFVKLDLSPSIGQKVNLLRLASKLPDVKVPHDDLKGAVLREVLDDGDLGLDYAKDVEPWIGDQVAAAEVATPGAGEGTASLLAVEFTDRAKMEAALDRARSAVARKPGAPEPTSYPTPTAVATPRVQISCVGIGSNAEPGVNPNGVVTVGPSDRPTLPAGTYPPRPTQCFDITPPASPTYAATPTVPLTTDQPARSLAYAVRGSYVLISDDRAVVDRAVTSARTLSDVPSYVADADEIDGGGQLVAGWADVGAAYDAATKLDRHDLIDAFGTRTRPTGTVVGGIHAEPSYLEADVATHGLRFLDDWFPVSDGQGAGLVDTLPADTSMAFEAANLGAAASRVWSRLGHTSDLLGLEDAAKSTGVRLPADLEAVLGEDLVAGARFPTRHRDSFDMAARARTGQPDRALDVLKIVTSSEPDAHGQRTPDGYVWGTEGEVYRQLLSGQGGLGQDPSFRTVVADPERADALWFVRVQDLLRLFDSVAAGGNDDSLAHLDAFGVSVSGTPGDGRLVARLSVR